MTRLIVCALIAMSMSAFQPASQAEAATVVTWGAPALDDFDSEQLTFPGFTANALTLISGPGFYQDGGEDRTFSLELELDGVWTTVGSSDPSGGLFSHELLSDINTPKFFTSATVTGIGFFVDGGAVGFAFNDLSGTQFTFDTLAVTETPLPAPLILFGSGLGMLGLFGWRKRDRAAAGQD
jgi:hypothetical protein